MAHCLLKYIQGFDRNTVPHPIIGTVRGEYWRLLLPGNYNIIATAAGFESSIKQVTVGNETMNPTRLDFQLKPVATVADAPP
ncbi:carboxypeptidase N catalytic chain-like [Diaphorina citri]|uniref:Carboxypeptidase N catalytic chain-like n=1 Tax=Diaphorina citri TaxID=121845 RepID=A0A1S3D8C2_DIACI|nr:carboxypeptidase N catalytic chain-like [Diaphorina citri]